MTTKRVFATVFPEDVGDANLRSFQSTLTGELSYVRQVIWDLADKRRFAVDRLIDRHAKRMRFSSVGDLETKAFADFVQTNNLCGQKPIDLPPDVISNARLFIRRALENFTSQNADSIQEVLDLPLLLSLWKFGPGSSRGTKATHFHSKIRLKRGTVTRRALPLARLLWKYDPHLSGLIPENKYRFVIVKGSKLSTVPKNEETRRTIGTEPLWNMALQLAAGMYIEGALRTVGIDICTQEGFNKLLASSAHDLGLSTIDLKSASDMISIALIKLLWPTEWYFLFSQIRSEVTDISGSEVRLNMMSTMGNGFTFPMMTLTLLALIYATVPGKPMHIDYNKVGIYGDDIIVSADDFPVMCETLAQAGLVVNTAKSYCGGDFFESCGGDYYKGALVTPFYVKSLRSDPEIYVAINQLLDWCCEQEVYLYQTFSLLVSMLREKQKPLLIPMWCAPEGGIQTTQVRRRYSQWKPIMKILVTGTKHPLVIKSITGGYVTSAGTKLGYSPRRREDDLVEYELVSFRLPKGYLDGSIASKRWNLPYELIKDMDGADSPVVGQIGRAHV